MFSVQLGAIGFLLSSISVSGQGAKCTKDHKDSHCWYGPDSKAAQPAWGLALNEDRHAVQKNISWAQLPSPNPYGSIHWTQTSYIQTQLHPFDRFFYDPATKEYTVAKYLQDLKDRYGGIDSVLIWPSYPMTGIDDRNQFDFLRSLPGGLDGVAKFIGDFHDAGVKVLLPLLPWDDRTRPEHRDGPHVASLLKQINADGANGDTMDHFAKTYWDAANNVQHPIALEPERGGTDAALAWSSMGWGYWATNPANPKTPVVDRYKFITDGKFMTHVCDRWARDHTGNLQMAWFNGDGFESWENVWGTWNGITERNGEAIRRVGTMLRFLGQIMDRNKWEQIGTNSCIGWEPHWDPNRRGPPGHANSEDVFASKWSLGCDDSDHSSSDHVEMWTIVNRGDDDIFNYTMYLAPRQRGGKDITMKYYDCYHGVELTPVAARSTGDVSVVLSAGIEQGGFGCVFGMESGTQNTFRVHKLVPLLKEMKGMTQNTLASYDNTWKYSQQTMVDIPKVGFATSAPEGTVFVGAGSFWFQSEGNEVETSDDGVDVQYAWEEYPRLKHEHTMQIDAFYIDKFPVTAAKYAAYVKATGYKPADPYNWLKSWHGSPEPPAKVAELPVTHVSLNEARAYCAWAGGRLPHSYEWQYAAQGNDGRTYPWGSDKSGIYQANYPVRKTGRTYTGPEPVTAHSPAGDSPFGMSDVVGNVWQYTDEFQDAHTRSVILKGGSNYRPTGDGTGGVWYFLQALELNKHNKLLLMDDSYERAGTVGFRCLVDAAPPTPSTIQATESNLCLDLPGGGTDNGALLWMWSCYGGETQQWSFQGDRLVYTADPTKCVDLLGGNTADGMLLGLWDCYEGASTQQWGFDPSEGTIYLASSAQDATKCMGTITTYEGDNVQIWDCDDTDQMQIWRVASELNDQPPAVFV